MRIEGGSTRTPGECKPGDPLLPVPEDCHAYMECEPMVNVLVNAKSSPFKYNIKEHYALCLQSLVLFWQN